VVGRLLPVDKIALSLVQMFVFPLKGKSVSQVVLTPSMLVIFLTQSPVEPLSVTIRPCILVGDKMAKLVVPPIIMFVVMASKSAMMIRGHVDLVVMIMRIVTV